MPDCPCGSGRTFAHCCGPCLEGSAEPETAEALMRARYTAHTRVDVDYILRTHDPAGRDDIDYEATRRWAAQADWLGLEILRSEGGTARDAAGTIEFVAHFREHGERRRHHEIASFRRNENGSWRFIDGTLPEPRTVRRQAPRVGRNDPCPCGSGRKFKKCCGSGI